MSNDARALAATYATELDLLIGMDDEAIKVWDVQGRASITAVRRGDERDDLQAAVTEWAMWLGVQQRIYLGLVAEA